MANGNNGSGFAERQLVTFLLEEDEFGADIMNVREIIRVPEITRIPNAPAYIEGACNLRGNVLPIIDGRARFNMKKKERDENSRVLVIDVNGKATGMVVDRVSEVMRVNMEDIEEAPKIVKSMDSDYLNGVVKLDNGNRLIMLLDIVKAVSAENKGKTPAAGKQDGNVHNGAEEKKLKRESIEEEHLVSFLLDKEEYAVGIMQVKEIIRVPEITRVPNCEAYIEGVVSIRNQLLPIINMRTYFGMQNKETTDRTRILVTDVGGFTVGIMVDKVSEVIRVSSSFIQPPPSFSTQAGELLKGVAKLNGGKRMILMLEPSKLLTDAEYMAISGSVAGNESDKGEKSAVRQMLDEEQLVTFRIDAEEYGIKINNVQEINRMTEITKIPRAPSYIEGIVNLRGSIIPALALRKLFRLPEVQKTDAARVIIVDLNGKKTGIIVDSVSEVLRFEKSLIELPPEILSSGIDSDYIEGVGKLNQGKRMIQILNIDKILNCHKVAV